MNRADIVREAREWIGTPFLHQQRQKGVACDCAGLLIGVLRELGAVAPDFDVNGYSRIPDGVSLRQHCDRYMRPIPAAAMQPGDAILVAWGHDGLPQHLGILADYYHPGRGLSLIHAESRRHRQVIETRLLFGRTMRLVAAYAMPGVTEP